MKRCSQMLKVFLSVFFIVLAFGGCGDGTKEEHIVEVSRIAANFELKFGKELEKIGLTVDRGKVQLMAGGKNNLVLIPFKRISARSPVARGMTEVDPIDQNPDMGDGQYGGAVYVDDLGQNPVSFMFATDGASLYSSTTSFSGILGVTPLNESIDVALAGRPSGEPPLQINFENGIPVSVRTPSEFWDDRRYPCKNVRDALNCVGRKFDVPLGFEEASCYVTFVFCFAKRLGDCIVLGCW